MAFPTSTESANSPFLIQEDINNKTAYTDSSGSKVQTKGATRALNRIISRFEASPPQLSKDIEETEDHPSAGKNRTLSTLTDKITNQEIDEESGYTIDRLDEYGWTKLTDTLRKSTADPEEGRECTEKLLQLLRKGSNPNQSYAWENRGKVSFDPALDFANNINDIILLLSYGAHYEDNIVKSYEQAAPLYLAVYFFWGTKKELPEPPETLEDLHAIVRDLPSDAVFDLTNIITEKQVSIRSNDPTVRTFCTWLSKQLNLPHKTILSALSR